MFRSLNVLSIYPVKETFTMDMKRICPECGKFEVSEGYCGLCRRCHGVFVKSTNEGISSSEKKKLRLKTTGEISVLKEL